MHLRIFRLACILPAFVFAAAMGSTAARAAPAQEELVTKADATFGAFRSDPKMEWLAKNLGKAKAVVIAPSIVKAGFILGGSGG
ncbi:MAG: hypothetical protein RL341_364, partial [Pseudomonadota bacterium]